MSDPDSAPANRESDSARVGVVIRTQNRPVLLARALASVLGQTFEDLRIVVVNDGGDRSAVDACVEQANQPSSRLEVVHREVSTGMEAATNAGLRRLETDFVAIHDDDDTWHPDFLSTTVAYLDSQGGQGVATRCEVVFESFDGAIATVERREILAAERDQVLLTDLVRENSVPPISLLYRRTVLEEIGFYDESLTVLGDWEFNLRFLVHYPIGFLDGPPLAFWHQRPSSRGAESNSVIGGRANHERVDQLLRDRALREYLTSAAPHARLGLLLALSRTMAEYATEAREHRDQLGLAVEDLKARLEQRLGELESQASRTGYETASNAASMTELERRLEELNRNIVGQSNRLVAQMDTLHEKIEQLHELMRPRGLTRLIAAIRDTGCRRSSQG